MPRQRGVDLPWALAKSGGIPADRLVCAMLGEIKVVHYRLSLSNLSSSCTLPMLRGVWGKSIWDLDRAVFQSLFEGGLGPEDLRQPRYVLSRLVMSSDETSSVELSILNPSRVDLEVAMHALERAARMGLGPRREVFAIEELTQLGADRSRIECSSEPWSLGSALSQIDPGIGLVPCEIDLVTSTRLVHRRTEITRPSYADIVVAGSRRLGRFLPDGLMTPWAVVSDALLEHAKAQTFTWEGAPSAVKRWSARQRQEMKLQGVIGRLSLPGGLQAAWPLVQALTYLSVGKGSAFGMGQVQLTWIRQ